MTWFLFLGFLAAAVATQGVGEAVAGLLGGLLLDVPVAFLIGAPLGDIFQAWALMDDALVLMARLELKAIDRFWLNLASATAERVIAEGIEQARHTHQQNVRWEEYLQREHPNLTYVWGRVTTKDIFELGSSLGVLAYRGSLQTVFQVTKDRVMNVVEVTSNVLAM